MRELVRNEDVLVPGPVLVGARIGQPVDERRRAHVLHAAEEIGDRRLRVLLPRIRNAGEPRVDRRSCPGVTRNSGQASALSCAIDVVVHRDAMPRVVHLHERRDDHGDEVRRARTSLTPVQRARAARIGVSLHERAVGDRGEAGGTVASSSHVILSFGKS